MRKKQKIRTTRSISLEVARAIRGRLRAGGTVTEIGEEFGVSTSTVSRILQGRHWSNPKPLPRRRIGRKRGSTGFPNGAAHHNSTITVEQGREIQRRLWAGERTRALADEFQVSVVVIHKILHGQHWTVREEGMPPEWMTAAHAAEFIGVQGEAVIDWIRKEWIHGIVVERGNGAPPIYAVSGAEVIRAKAQWQGRGSLRPDLCPPREPQYDICAHCGEEFCDCADVLREAEVA